MKSGDTVLLKSGQMATLKTSCGIFPDYGHVWVVDVEGEERHVLEGDMKPCETSQEK